MFMREIGKFRWWCYKVLPLVYDDSLSYYELLCKVIKKLNEVIDSYDGVYEAYNELREFVDHYFDNLDVQEEINNKLDEMAEDGTLSALIGVEIFGTSNMALRNGIVDFGEPILIDTPEMQNLGIIQGVAFGGNNVYTSYSNTTGCHIAKWSLDGTFISKLSGDFGHVNDLAYKDGMLYVTAKNASILVIDTTTMTLSDTIVISNWIGTEEAKGIAFVGNDLFVNLGVNIYKVEEGVATEYCVCANSGLGTSQGMAMDNNYIYLVRSEPNHIEMFDHTGVYRDCINIGNTPYGTFPVDELEGVCITPDGLLISYLGQYSKYSCVSKIYTAFHGIKFDGNDWNESTVYYTVRYGTWDKLNNIFPNIMSAYAWTKQYHSVRCYITVEDNTSSEEVTIVGTGGNSYCIQHNTGVVFTGKFDIYDGNIWIRRFIFDTDNANLSGDGFVELHQWNGTLVLEGVVRGDDSTVLLLKTSDGPNWRIITNITQESGSTAQPLINLGHSDWLNIASTPCGTYSASGASKLKSNAYLPAVGSTLIKGMMYSVSIANPVVTDGVQEIELPFSIQSGQKVILLRNHTMITCLAASYEQDFFTTRDGKLIKTRVHFPNMNSIRLTNNVVSMDGASATYDTPYNAMTCGEVRFIP